MNTRLLVELTIAIAIAIAGCTRDNGGTGTTTSADKMSFTI